MYLLEGTFRNSKFQKHFQKQQVTCLYFLLSEGAVPRQGSPYIWYEDYGEQKYLNEHHRENRNSPFGTNSDAQFQ
jgi:hypothetical protein